MATATKKAHAGPSATRAARGASEPVSLAFRTYQDNGEGYHWEIVDGAGKILAQSGSFASEDDAERAAREVHKSARVASFASQAVKQRDAVVA
jgi:uncharacterized protein YegP (UPF0339 family)